MTTLFTTRLELHPMTVPFVEAVVAGHRALAEELARARLPDLWPGRALIERAFSASLERIREAPGAHLWGHRLMITRHGERFVVGSVVFHNEPDESGTVEIAYGVEGESQGKGYATEAVMASLEWALDQPRVTRVTATTFPWHARSRRVIAKCGMVPVDTVEHETMGEMLVFERRRESQPQCGQPPHFGDTMHKMGSSSLST